MPIPLYRPLIDGHLTSSEVNSILDAPFGTVISRTAYVEALRTPRRSKMPAKDCCSGNVQLLWPLLGTCPILDYLESLPGSCERLGFHLEGVSDYQCHECRPSMHYPENSRGKLPYGEARLTGGTTKLCGIGQGADLPHRTQRLH